MGVGSIADRLCLCLRAHRSDEQQQRSEERCCQFEDDLYGTHIWASGNKTVPCNDHLIVAWNLSVLVSEAATDANVLLTVVVPEL